MVLGRIVLSAAALCLLTLPIAGCAGCTGDPSQAGFSCGVANAVSGTYDRRIAEREAALASTRGTSTALQGQLEDLDRELASLDRQEQSMQRQLQQIGSQNRSLRTRLTEARSRQSASDAQLRALERQLDDLERRRVRLGNPSPDSPQDLAELEALRTQTAELQQIIDGLTEGAEIVE